MTWPDFYLLCFALGNGWTLVTLLFGGLHFGHGHTGGHFQHGGQVGHGPLGHGAHIHAGHSHTSTDHFGSWLGSLVNPSSVAVFLAWFGGVGYLLTRHTGMLFWIDLAIAAVFGLLGAWLLASFLRFLQSHEKPLDPADYGMVGVLGHVSSSIRPDGVGELIYVRDGARRMVPARSEDGTPIGRGEEVIITRYEKGFAYVRTWEEMVTQPGAAAQLGQSDSGESKETKDVQ